jgi:hypothetical protein
MRLTYREQTVIFIRAAAVILTPIAPEELASHLALFAANLGDWRARVAFARIARTSAVRAKRTRAEIDRRRAERLAIHFGIPVWPGSPARNFGWDGRIMRGGTEAYVLLHEIAHYRLAPKARRRRHEFGLGPGPETGHAAAASRAAILLGMGREREEAKASLLGILWEAELGQPALASFLDQNWLEGAERPGAARHFERSLAALMRDGLVSPRGRPLCSTRHRMRLT